MTRRSLTPLVIFLIMVAGCVAEPPDDNVLRLALETSPNKLDPAFVVDVEEGQICALIFQGLVRFSPAGDVLPDAARAWNLSADGLRYTFAMDARARFSNGARLTSHDVVGSFRRVLDPEGRSPRRWVLDRIAGADAFMHREADDIAGLQAPDDSTVVIEIAEPFRPFIQLLAMPAARIVPADLGGHRETDFASSPIGSGAWKIDRWERGNLLTLVPNAHFAGERPSLDEVRFRIIPEAFTRVAEFESGTLDILKLPDAEVDRFLADRFRRDLVQERPELRVFYIGLNNRRGALANVDVRRALNHAVNVDQLIRVLTFGNGIRAAGSIPPSLGGYAARQPYAYDPALARRLLADAGYGEGLDLEVWMRNSPTGNLIVEAIQGYLRPVGIRVTIVKREWSAFKEAVSLGKVDAFFLDWFADYPDGENFLYPLFHSANAGGGGNRAFVDNPQIDALIERSQRVSDETVGERLYAQVDSLTYAHAPWIYLYFPTRYVVVSPRIENYVYPVLYMGEDLTRVVKRVKS